MSAPIVLLIILACTAYQYLKGTLVKSAFTFIIAICAAIAAFAYFELLAGLIISRTSDPSTSKLAAWALPLSFALIFVLSFAILQAVASQIIRKSVEFEAGLDKIGRSLCGLLTGFIVSGVVITALAMAPLSETIPYRRFQPGRLEPKNANKALLNADGLTAGLFSLISRGSLSGKNSFAVIHPSYINEAFLNRQGINQHVHPVATANAIRVSPTDGARLAPENLKYTDGYAVEAKSGHDLVIVKVEFVRRTGDFTLSQLRLICNLKTNIDKPLTGQGLDVYPIGYLKSSDQLQKKPLDQKIQLSEFAGRLEHIEFVFYVPKDYTPVAIAFKANSITGISKVATAPTPAPE